MLKDLKEKTIGDLLSLPSKIQEDQICKTIDQHLDLNGDITPDK